MIIIKPKILSLEINDTDFRTFHSANSDAFVEFL